MTVKGLKLDSLNSSDDIPGMVLLSTTSFSGVASQALAAGTFSSTYENYRLIFNISSGSADCVISFKMRVSGTDNSASYFYGGGGTYSDTTTTSSGGNPSIAGFRIAEIDSGTTENYSWSGDLYNPFLALNTRYQGFGADTGSTGIPKVVYNGGVHRVATSYDSINIIPSTGTITGKVYVYGYNL